MFLSTGILQYGPGIRLVLLADQGIADFYLSLVPKSLKVKPQFYPAHVSVVRREEPPNLGAWGLYEGLEVEFEYQPYIANDETYYWLPVQCKRIEEIRTELGLRPYPWWRNGYHLTIGNIK